MGAAGHAVRWWSIRTHANVRVPPQSVCPNPKRCKSSTFVYVEDSRECIDYQEIKIQEQVQSLSVGSIPRSIVVVLENDLVDTCKVRWRVGYCVASPCIHQRSPFTAGG